MRPLPPRLLAALCGALVLLAARAAGATDINVPAGASVHDAIRSARPGDRVLLRAGVHRGGDWIGPLSGTAAQPITILSADGPRRAVLEGGGETLRIGDASSYLIIDGLEVRGSGDNAIHIDGGSHHITLRNVFAHDAGVNGDVMKVNQAHHITVEDSEFARPGRRTSDAADNPYQECLDFVDVDDVVVRRSFFHDGGSMLFFVKGGSRNVLIEQSVFADQRAGASDPMVGLGGATDAEFLQGEQYEAFNVVFRNNVVANSANGGVGIYDANGVYVANNLFLNNNRVVIEFRAGNGPAAASDNVRVVNNIVADYRGRLPAPFIRSSHAVRGLTTSHNVYWNNGAAVPSNAFLPLATQPGYLVANPLVGVPPAGADLPTIVAAVRPRATSPAGGSGIDASGAPFGVVADFDGVPRAGRLDRGPFSLAVSPPPVVPPPVVPPPAPTPVVVTGAPACVCTQAAGVTTCACTSTCRLGP